MTALPKDEEKISSTPEPLRRRYMATLAGHVIKLALAVSAAALVPRALGPAAYGNLNFLLGTATTLRGFFEPGVQQAFFTFSSQDPRSGALTRLYLLFALGQLAALLLLVAVAWHGALFGLLWPGQQLDQVLLVTVLDWAAFLALSIQQLGDSKGLTTRPQAITAAVSAATVAGLVWLYLSDRLDFYSYVWLNLGAAAVSFIAVGYWLFIRHGELCWHGSLRGRAREFILRWWRFAAPLIALDYYLPLIAFAGIYLIQFWYGPEEQGYYSLALRWSAVALIFTTAANMIVWREIAHAFARGDSAHAHRVFVRFNRLLSFLALALASWLFIVSENLVLAFAGESYRSAIPAMMIMAFYPVAQTHGQLNTAAFKAMGRTAEYRNLSIALSIPDLILTYFLLAAPSAAIPGLGLGAVGMALKITVLGLFSVHVLEWVNARYLGMQFWHETRRKLLVALAIAGCAATAYAAGGWIAADSSMSRLEAIVYTSTIYFVLVGMVTLKFPVVAGLTHQELQSTWSAIRALLRYEGGGRSAR